MKLFKRWRQEQPLKLPVRLVGEAEIERWLKKQLSELLRQHVDIERAYLARTENRGQNTLVFCIVAKSNDVNANILQEVADILASNAREGLVTLFISDAQEAELRLVCAPFYLAKSREEILNDIASVRAVARSYLGSEDAFLRPRIPFVIEMLDMIEARVQAMTWPPEYGAFDDINIGLYAVRELDEIDDGRLSDPVCKLDYTLKHL